MISHTVNAIIRTIMIDLPSMLAALSIVRYQYSSDPPYRSHIITMMQYHLIQCLDCFIIIILLSLHRYTGIANTAFTTHLILAFLLILSLSPLVLLPTATNDNIHYRC